jgi:hypothetical protein
MGRAVLPSPSRSGQAQDLLCGGGSLIFGAMLASLLADAKPVVIGAKGIEVVSLPPEAGRSQATVGLRPSQVQTAPRATIGHPKRNDIGSTTYCSPGFEPTRSVRGTTRLRPKHCIFPVDDEPRGRARSDALKLSSPLVRTTEVKHGIVKCRLYEVQSVHPVY